MSSSSCATITRRCRLLSSPRAFRCAARRRGRVRLRATSAQGLADGADGRHHRRVRPRRRVHGQAVRHRAVGAAADLPEQDDRLCRFGHQLRPDRSDRDIDRPDDRAVRVVQVHPPWPRDARCRIEPPGRRIDGCQPGPHDAGRMDDRRRACRGRRHPAVGRHHARPVQVPAAGAAGLRRRAHRRARIDAGRSARFACRRHHGRSGLSSVAEDSDARTIPIASLLAIDSATPTSRWVCTTAKGSPPPMSVRPASPARCRHPHRNAIGGRFSVAMRAG